MINRRTFLGAAAGAVFWPAARGIGAHHAEKPAKTQTLESLLEGSEFVYISPLDSQGEESRCHGEVWYGWLDRGVVIVTSRETWKARSLARGRDRARIWVGNYGRVKGLLGANEAFRKARHFDALASEVKDAAVLERLITLYETKYPREIAKWRDKFRSGYADGSRMLIRYTPA